MGGHNGPEYPANGQAAANLPGYHGGKGASELPTLSEIAARLSKRHGADDAAPDLPLVSTIGK